MYFRAIVVLIVSLFVAAPVAAKPNVVYSIRLQRTLGKRIGGIVVECERTQALECFLQKLEGESQNRVWHGKVDDKPVEAVVKRFFSRLPASEVSPSEAQTDVFSQVPHDAILKWEIVASGKRSWGWITAQEFQGNLLKKGVLEQLIKLETELAGLSR